jgi:hypothetical protein
MRERWAKGNGARSAFAVLTIAAWFCLSNHCALGLALPATEPIPAAETDGCPMHSAPAKKNPATTTPCCKNVRAVVAKTVAATAIIARSIGAQTFAAQLVTPPPRLPTEVELLDTGPPGRFSFAELVLQESMHAHAPPVS